MSQRKQKSSSRVPGNRKKLNSRKRESFLSTINKRSHAKTNRRLNSRSGKAVWAATAYEDEYEDGAAFGLIGRLTRWVLAILLLPFCWVTTWTFLARFSHATIEQDFWLSHQFWYFAVGVVLMLGWFWSGLAKSFFLYLYVFGHELTHAIFVKFFGGKVLDMEWSSEGGYVTTDKTNWVIALSPYFVPFWSLIAVVIYTISSLFFEILPFGNQVFYGCIGATWAFHLAWTLWMIPRDQPDLQDNGTFLSLVLIYFGNLVVLITLLCVASPSPLESLREFGTSWFSTAVIWGDTGIRYLVKFADGFL